MLQDRGLELRTKAADVDWLKAALADSEKRSAQQSEWLNAMEEELTLLRTEGDCPTTPKTGQQSDEIR